MSGPLDTQAHVETAKALGQPVADKDKVHALVEEWRKAFEFAVNHPEDGKLFGYVDAFMALVNFNRLLLEDIEERCGFKTKEAKFPFRLMFINTITRTLIKRLEDE